jgi:hypothetical protein
MESFDFLSANQNPRLPVRQNVHQARRITFDKEGRPGSDRHQSRLVAKQRITEHDVVFPLTHIAVF